MSRYLKVESCKECPFRDHSGGFTKGGPQLLCNNPKTEKVPAGLFHYKRPLLNKKNPTQWSEQIPDFCPLLKIDEV